MERMTSKDPSHIPVTDSGWENQGAEKCQRVSRTFGGARIR